MPEAPLPQSAALILSFACWMTAHLGLVWGLFKRRSPRWHALLALIPLLAWLAPFWGLEHGMKRRVSIWALCFAAYVVSLIVALSYAG
jgi:uncharacterized membrane protein YbaN (DUF454 family)